MSWGQLRDQGQPDLLVLKFLSGSNPWTFRILGGASPLLSLASWLCKMALFHRKESFSLQCVRGS